MIDADPYGRFIVVEGMDRFGKDTLIAGLRKLIQNPRLLVTHASKPPTGVDSADWSQEYYYNQLELGNALTSIGWEVIANRLHVGETVYGPLFRGYLSDYIWDIEREWMCDNMWLIVIVDSGESALSRDDGMSHETCLADFNAVRDRFIDGYETSGIPNKILIDVSADGWPDPNKIYGEIYGKQ